MDGRLVYLDTYLRERVINEETSVYFKCLFVCCEFEPPLEGSGGILYSWDVTRCADSDLDII